MSKYKFIKIEDEDINEIEDKIYLIPMYNLETLEKKLNKMRNKGANIEYEDLGEERVADNNGRYHLCKKIKVSGHYQINGWEFIATIEHSGNDGENVIRKITDDPISDKFWTAKPYCEHCKAERNRRDTYLVKNINTGEIKQVGRQCLQDYTGLDASVAASYASILKELDRELSALADDEVLSMIKGPKYVGDDTDQVKKVMFRYIKENGYNKDQILNHIYNIFQEGFDKYIQDGPDYSQDIENMNGWVNELDASSNDYIRNAKSVWNKAVIEQRDWKILASFIASYLKDVQRRSEGTNTQYNSNKVGDKITITIKSLRILFRSGTQFGISYTYRIIGEDGLIYIYKTGKELHEGDTINAVIVEFKEYRGEKQTIIKTTKSGIIVDDQFKPGYQFKLNRFGKFTYYKIISIDPLVINKYEKDHVYGYLEEKPYVFLIGENISDIFNDNFKNIEELKELYKTWLGSDAKSTKYFDHPTLKELIQYGRSEISTKYHSRREEEEMFKEHFHLNDSEYLFIKLTDAKDLNYVYKLKFVYKDKDGSLKRVSKDKIEQHYNKLKGKYSDAQVYYMILRADEDCDRYIELHKDDKPEEPIKKEVEPTKEKFKGSKQEYIEKMIAKGYSEEDAEELAENAYGGD